MAQKCEGYRRFGGAFSLGPVTWVQCSEKATVIINVTQDGETKEFPACFVCLTEAMNTPGIKVNNAKPILE